MPPSSQYALFKSSAALVDNVVAITTKSGVGRWILGPNSNEGSPIGVVNVAALAALSNAPLSDGTHAWVVAAGGTHGLWIYDTQSVAAINNLTVVGTLTGAGRWIYFGFAATPAIASISVNNEAALSAVNVVSFLDGARAYVESHRSFWTIRTQSLGIQPHEIIASTDGARQWVRETLSHLSWELQATWFVDSGAGSDEADGSTAPTALQTNAELWRRLGYGADAIIRQITTFQFVGNFAVADPLILSLRLTGAGVYTVFRGTVTVTSGPVEVVAKSDLARPTLPTMTGQPGIAAFVGQRVTIMAGAAAGDSFWLARVIAGDQIETSVPITAMPIPNTGIAAQTVIVAGAGNTYQTETLSRIDRVNVSIKVDDVTGPPNFNSVYLVDLDLSAAGSSGPAIFGPTTSTTTIIQGCMTRPATIQGPASSVIYDNCRMVPTTSFGGGSHNILDGMTLGTGSTQTWQTQTWVIYDQDHVFQAARLRVRRNGQVEFGTCCIQNATGAGFTIEADALDTKNFTFLGGAHLLYGTGNSGVGVSVGSGRAFFYAATKPTLTGVGGDTTIGSAAVTAYGAVPFVFKAAATDNNAQMNVAFP